MWGYYWCTSEGSPALLLHLPSTLPPLLPSLPSPSLLQLMTPRDKLIVATHGCTLQEAQEKLQSSKKGSTSKRC